MGILGFKVVLPAILAIVALGSLGFSQDAFAATCTTQNNAPWGLAFLGGDCPTAIPTAADDVVINHTVLLGTSQTIGSLTVNGDLTIFGPGDGITVTTPQLRINPGGNVDNSGSIVTTGFVDIVPFGKLNNLPGGSVIAADDIIVTGGSGFVFNACGATMSTGDDVALFGGGSIDNDGLLTIGGDYIDLSLGTLVNDGVVSIAGTAAPFTDNGNSCAALISPIVTNTSGDDAAGTAKPTLGKVKNGFLAVEGGFCFNLYCVDVLDYFNHLELQQVGSNDSFTITLTGYFPAGADRANYASIGAAPPGGDINDSLWTVMAKRVGTTDQWEVMTNDEGGNLGAVTVTVQKVDNSIVSFAFTIQSHTPASIGTPEGDVEPSEDNLILVTDLRDNRGNSVRNIFNEGFFVNDPYAYPEVQADFEASLEVEKLCLNEDSTDRNTCAFDKVKDWSIVQAEQALAEMYGVGFQGDFAESEQYDLSQ